MARFQLCEAARVIPDFELSNSARPRLVKLDRLAFSLLKAEEPRPGGPDRLQAEPRPGRPDGSELLSLPCLRLHE